MKYSILVLSLAISFVSNASVIETSFGSTNGVKFFGDATYHTGEVVLTESLENKRGGMMLGALQSLDNLSTWNAQFDFSISEIFRGGADGIAFGVMRDDAVFDQWRFSGEEGIASGLAIGYDSYDNNEGSANHISVRYDGALLTQISLNSFGINLKTDTFFTSDVAFNNGLLDVSLNGSQIISDFAISGWSAFDGQFYMSARTGYSASRQAVSGITINTVAVPEPQTFLLLVLSLAGMVYRKRR